MSSYLSDFEHYKLDAHVFPGYVIETHYISDPTSGQRRVPSTKIWKVERVLGKGGYGEVRLEVNTEGNEKRAVKRIWTSGSTLKKEYERELKALLEFSKPKYKESAAFVDFLGWFEDHECVYLAMEYVPLGDLEQNIPSKGSALKEEEIKDITAQLLEGLKIMHLEKFVHRDLKPKNVLVCQGSPRWWVKLADFGLSKRRTEETAYRTQTGTHAYMAPEILNYVPGVNSDSSEYTEAIDIWALGCIVFLLASGSVPFPPGLSLVRFCDRPSAFPSQKLALSELGTTFIRELIVPYPSERLTAQQALKHAWIIGNSGPIKKPAPAGELTNQTKLSETNSSSPFSAYNTVTHAGLRSTGSSTFFGSSSQPKTAIKQPSGVPYLGTPNDPLPRAPYMYPQMTQMAYRNGAPQFVPQPSPYIPGQYGPQPSPMLPYPQMPEYRPAPGTRQVGIPSMSPASSNLPAPAANAVPGSLTMPVRKTAAIVIKAPDGRTLDLEDFKAPNSPPPRDRSPAANAVPGSLTTFSRPVRKTASIVIKAPDGRTLDLEGFKAPNSPPPRDRSPVQPIVESSSVLPSGSQPASSQKTEFLPEIQRPYPTRDRPLSSEPAVHASGELIQTSTPISTRNHSGFEANPPQSDIAEARSLSAPLSKSAKRRAARAKAAKKLKSQQVSETSTLSILGSSSGKNSEVIPDIQSNPKRATNAKISVETKSMEDAEVKAALDRAKQQEEDELERLIMEMEEAEAARERKEAEFLAKRNAAKAKAAKADEEKRKKEAEEMDRRLRETEREMERLEDERERKRAEERSSSLLRRLEKVNDAINNAHE